MLSCYNIYRCFSLFFFNFKTHRVYTRHPRAVISSRLNISALAIITDVYRATKCLPIAGDNALWSAREKLFHRYNTDTISSFCYLLKSHLKTSDSQGLSALEIGPKSYALLGDSRIQLLQQPKRLVDYI